MRSWLRAFASLSLLGVLCLGLLKIENGILRTYTEEARLLAKDSSVQVASSHASSRSSIVQQVDDQDDDDDGCGLDQNGNRARWAPASSTDRDWLRDVRTCVKQFELTDVKIFGKFDEKIKTLQCELKVDSNLTRTALSHYDTVWFLGDSLLIQQFYTLICMFNPQVTKKDMKYYKPHFMGSADDLINAEYIHNNSTRFLYSRFGYTWAPEENNLYKYAFPSAVHTLTDRDAIVMDGSSHYNSTRLGLMERAMSFIRDKSVLANASMFYIESSPEEWPTSNGLYIPSCYKKCHCQALTRDQIAGQWNVSHVTQINRTQESHRSMPNISSFEKYVGNLSHYPINGTDCFPDCLPAPWKSMVARTILSDSHVDIVPMFWQFVDKGTPSNARFGDCTHKSQEGITMMNQQLIRTMVKRQEETSASQEKGSTVLQQRVKVYNPWEEASRRQYNSPMT